MAAPGLDLGIVVIVRNEAPYLEEWLCYHLAVGVQHVFLYDNGSDDGLHEVVDRYVNHGLVSVVHWPLPGGQIDAYSHALRFFGPSVEWLAFIDVDEFIVPLVDDDIPALLARWPDAADVRLPRVDFAFSGHRSPPPGLTIEAYTQVADVFERDPDKAPRVKAIVRPRGVSAVGIHTATVADVPIARDGRPVPTASVRQGARGLAQVNHYYTRSFEEFEAKRFRGSATGRLARPAIPFDIATLAVDVSAHRFAERTRAMIERIHSLEARPYHYGSQLALAQFPRSNDLGLFAEFAVANVAAGLAEPSREPVIRLPNLCAATGFVGDVSAAGLAPSRGVLSGSVHLGPLLDHVRGRLEASLADASEQGRWRWRSGSVDDDGEAWTLRGVDGDVEVAVEIDPVGMRRCYALGFVLEVSSPARIRLSLEVDPPVSDAIGAPVEVELGHAGAYAGVVEIGGDPALVSRAVARFSSTGGVAVLHDLFLVSYG